MKFTDKRRSAENGSGVQQTLFDTEGKQMVINRVEIEDFMAFKGEFSCEFRKGVNVLIGRNGTGKTTLLKVMYGADKYAYFADDTSYNKPLEYLFDVKKFQNSKGVVHVNATTFDVIFYINDDGKHNPSGKTKQVDVMRSVYIPSNEMLSHSRGFLALCREREMPFDATEIDILSKAQLGNTIDILPNATILLEKIKQAIGGEVLYESDTFYISSESKKLPFSLEASGFQKLGLLWKLLRNGLLESGSVLFWDEPENSLNPEFIPVLVDVILELAAGGVQIFLATHSDFLCKWFELKTGESEAGKIQFISLYKENDTICKEKNESYRSLEHNSIVEQSVELYNAHVRRASANDED
jgi:AAA15 family ATPase/GTPase